MKSERSYKDIILNLDYENNQGDEVSAKLERGRKKVSAKKKVMDHAKPRLG